ncbi:Uncharacterised protein g2987 [Pycnogonum litorale]
MDNETISSNRCCKRLGLWIGLGSTLLMSVGTVMAGVIIDSVGPETGTAVACIAQGVISLPFMLRKNKWIESSKSEFIFAMLAGVSLAIFVYTKLLSIEYIPPVDGAALQQTALVFVMIFSYFWLKEPLGFYELFAIILIISGAFMVTKPEFIFGSMSATRYDSAWIGYLISMLSAMCSASASCFMRKLHNADPSFASCFQSIFGTMFLLAVSGYKMKTPRNVHEWMFCGLAATFGGACQFGYAIAYNLEFASTITGIASLELVFTMILQIIFMGIVPDWIIISGCLLIITGVSLLPARATLLRIIRCPNCRNCNRAEDPQILD